MAELNLDPLVNRVRGKLGNFVYKQVSGAGYLARRPDFSNVIPTAAQEGIRNKFRLAAGYGRAVMADPTAKAIYEAVAKSRAKPIFSVIISDYMKAPEVSDIDLANYQGNIGDTITVKATDDFNVVSVEVEISTAGGIVETTAAVRSTTNPEFWVCTATAQAPGSGQIQIKATAADRPGNKTTKTKTK
jgi:hypothetical protein